MTASGADRQFVVRRVERQSGRFGESLLALPALSRHSTVSTAYLKAATQILRRAPIYTELCGFLDSNWLEEPSAKQDG